MILLGLLLASTALIGFSGCASTKNIVLHPIEKSDIFSVKSGESFTSEKDGWFLSDQYVEEVMKAKVDSG